MEEKPRKKEMTFCAGKPLIVQPLLFVDYLCKVVYNKSFIKRYFP